MVQLGVGTAWSQERLMDVNRLLVPNGQTAEGESASIGAPTGAMTRIQGA